jgi:hypothetical protein
MDRRQKDSFERKFRVLIEKQGRMATWQSILPGEVNGNLI